MKKSFWKTLLSSESLIEEAKQDSLRMLDAGQEMFHVVLHGMHEEREAGARQKVTRMDKALNNLQREVRKKVYEHLVVSRSSPPSSSTWSASATTRRTWPSCSTSSPRR
ncbi:MAG: hypothetical protein JRG91_21225 [Deltaproteobacteria bacterium]|nr:hypothetical protein [Deltaproteobacteria bacterium]